MVMRAGEIWNWSKGSGSVMIMLALMLFLGCQAGQEVAENSSPDVILLIGSQETVLKASRVVTISGQDDGSLNCDGNKLGLAGIAGAVSLRQGANPDLIAVIDLPPTFGCTELERLLAAVREGGVTNLAFTSDLANDRTAVPFMLPPVDLKLPPVPEDMKLTVHVSSEGDLSIDGQVLSRDEIVRQVASELQSVKGLVVYVEPVSGARYAEFFDLMLALREAGATRISLWGMLRAE
jgi:biopolymer transport protein ExbD